MRRGVFAALVIFGAVAGPALLFGLSTGLERTLPPVGAVPAVVLFFAREVSVPVRFRPSPQPSQPGRTSPDS